MCTCFCVHRATLCDVLFHFSDPKLEDLKKFTRISKTGTKMYTKRLYLGEVVFSPNFCTKTYLRDPKNTLNDQKWCSKYPNNVETSLSGLGKDFVILYFTFFWLKTQFLEQFGQNSKRFPTEKENVHLPKFWCFYDDWKWSIGRA